MSFIKYINIHLHIECLRVVNGEIDDTTGEVEVREVDVLDTTVEAEFMNSDDEVPRVTSVSGAALNATGEQEEEEEMTMKEWAAFMLRRLAEKELLSKKGGGHGQKPARQREDGHQRERVEGKTGRVPAPLLRKEGRREAARPRHRGGGGARD